jgi:hypothetical protein
MLSKVGNASAKAFVEKSVRPIQIVHTNTQVPKGVRCMAVPPNIYVFQYINDTGRFSNICTTKIFKCVHEKVKILI